MKGRIVINVSTSADWRRRPVGIVRVERELTKQLHRLIPEALSPVYLDKGARVFKTVPENVFQRIMSDEWVLCDDPDNAGQLTQERLPNFKARDSDLFVSVGSDWSFNIPDLLVELYGNRKVLLAACYDLIPLLLPEYTPGQEFRTQFLHHYDVIARTAKAVFAISENSKNDLVAHWKAHELSTVAPPIAVVRLAGRDKESALPELTVLENTELAEILSRGDYIIYVSTLEPRKNHQLLLDIWRELYAKRGEKCPRLIFIGMRGWASDELVCSMKRMQVYVDGYLQWLEGVSDALLEHLYLNSIFSVFPSVYEGWGLAATEAMSFGKICLVSNTSSLGEATDGMCPSLHPFDFPGWMSEIERLVDDLTYRRSIEQTISQSYATRTWRDFGADFLRKIIGMP